MSETCRILHLSRASYYRRRCQQQRRTRTTTIRASEEDLLARIRELAGEHPFWGYRRITSSLRHKQGLLVNKKRVRRLMREDSLSVPLTRYKAKRTFDTRSKPKPTRANEWWGTDMTKFSVPGLGWLYLVVVLDWYTKRALGYSLDLRPKTELWLKALDQAVSVACPLGSRTYGLSLMSDNGSQPTSSRYEAVIETLGITHATTSYNNPKGNADTERFMRTFKEEVVWPNEFNSLEEAQQAVRAFFCFYNEDYPHSALKGLSPVDFEHSLNQTQPAAAA